MAIKIEGVDMNKIINTFRKGEWLFLGFLFMVIGYHIWENDLDIIFFTFSIHNMSVGLISLGLIIAMIGLIKLVIDIVIIPSEDQITKKDILDLMNNDSISNGIIDEIMAIVRRQVPFFSGGSLMLIGFGFWDSEFDLSLSGLPLHDISAVLVFVGGLSAIIGGIQVLTDTIEIQVTAKDLQKMNPKVSYGLVAGFSIEGQDKKTIITFPETFPLSKEILDSFIEQSFSLLGIPKTEDGIHTIFSFPVADELCTVVTYGFQFLESEPSESLNQYFILSFIIRPPWGNQEDLATFIWDDRDNFAEFFNHLHQVRDLLREPFDNKALLTAMADFRSFFSKLILTLRKKHIGIFISP